MKKHRQDLESLIEERARQSQYGRMPVTNETLRQMQLQPQQMTKLMMQEPSPTKYSNPATGLLSPLIDSQYVKLHNKKV